MPKPSMTSGPLVPLYHPTSILLVDDNEAFLRSVQLVLGSGFECIAFKTASEAISFIRSEPARIAEVLTPTQPEIESAMEHIRDPDERMSHLMMARLPRVFGDRSRFARASVLVVDNTMPGMSGLGMIESLSDAPLRKVLLAEMVEEAAAQQALDRGLIDAFCPKHQPRLFDGLVQHLTDLQVAFFSRLTEPFRPALASSDLRFFREPAFGEVFASFARKHQIIEHCVLMHPPGILGINEEGIPSILLMVDDDYRQASFEIAQAEGAPVELLRQLIGPSVVAAFPTATGYYSKELEGNWEPFVRTGMPVGDNGWLAATLCECDVVRRACGSVASYSEHRQRRPN